MKAEQPPLFSDFQPLGRGTELLAFAYETFQKERGVTMIVGPGIMGPFNLMLKRTETLPEYNAENLKTAWLCFLHSKDKFHQRVPAPLRYFVNNIETFVGQAVRGGKSGRRTEVAREWVERRLKRDGQ